MIEKPPDKNLFKIYYSLLLLGGFKRQVLHKIDDLVHPELQLQELLKQDLQELNECIVLFKELIENSSLDDDQLLELVKQDPYHKMVYAIQEIQENNNNLSKDT